MAILHLVRGIPGSGKTSFVGTMLSNIPHFENDMYFYSDEKYSYDRSKMDDAIKWCLSNVENCLKSGIDVCVSNTFTKYRFVEGYKRLAEKYNAQFKVYRMMGTFENIHNVPENIMTNMKGHFDDYDGELFVYPNVNQSKDDPCFRPYMYTNLKVGDTIEVERFVHPESEHTLIFRSDGTKEERGFETEKCIATIESISQGTYDYLNIFYSEDDSGRKGMCMSGDCKKV